MKPGLMLVALLGWCATARADRSTEARQHFEQATAHFAVGEFAEAATEYQIAYKLKPDPALLYNAAQSYRLANNPEKAIILYKNYLQLYPNEPNAEDVRRQIVKLKDALAASESAKTSPPTGTTEPKQLPPGLPAEAAVAPPPTQPATAATTPSNATTAMKRETPIYKKWWLWTAVGAVVAGGVVTAAVLATRQNGTWANAPDVGPGSVHGLVQW